MMHPSDAHRQFHLFSIDELDLRIHNYVDDAIVCRLLSADLWPVAIERALENGDLLLAVAIRERYWPGEGGADEVEKLCGSDNWTLTDWASVLLGVEDRLPKTRRRCDGYATLRDAFQVVACVQATLESVARNRGLAQLDDLVLSMDALGDGIYGDQVCRLGREEGEGGQTYRCTAQPEWCERAGVPTASTWGVVLRALAAEDEAARSLWAELYAEDPEFLAEQQAARERMQSHLKARIYQAQELLKLHEAGVDVSSATLIGSETAPSRPE